LIKPDADFLEFLLFPDLKEQYKKEIKNELSKLEKKYSDTIQKLIKQKNEGIELDKNHRSLLNACIFPFSQDDSLQKYGYIFLMASALKELKISNLDFLLIDQSTL
jgi:hypothetical protein